MFLFRGTSINGEWIEVPCTRVMCLVVGQLLGLFAAHLLVEDVQEAASNGWGGIHEVA